MPDIAHSIRSFLTEARLPVLFYGAGVAVRAGLPGWHEYMTALADSIKDDSPTYHALLSQLIADGHYGVAADHYFQNPYIRENTLYENLARPLDAYDATALYDLVSLPFTAFITTNYDESLIDAYASVHGNIRRASLGDPALGRFPWESRSFLARIHGSVEAPERMVLSARQLEAVTNEQDYITLLYNVFTQRDVLFIGFSFDDPAITTVLTTIRAQCGTANNGRHMALLPCDAKNDFIQALEHNNIKHISYSPDESHGALWSAITSVAQERIETIPGTSDLLQKEPFQFAQRYLATCYARTRLGSRISPLRQSLAEGIVSAIVRESGSSGSSISDIKTALADELNLPTRLASPIVDEALHSLVGDGLCTIDNSNTDQSVTWRGDNESDYDTAIRQLVDGTVDRYTVREGGHDSPDLRNLLVHFFRTLVLQRGWDLGAAFASHDVPKSIDIDPLLDEAIRQTGHGFYGSPRVLARTIGSLLTKPDRQEAYLLAQLGRLSFGLELIAQAPHNTLFHELTLPERIYLDANVLMPAITEGHPYNETYRQAVDGLIDACRNASFVTEIVVYTGFLNETINHKRLALTEIDEHTQDTLSPIARDTRLHGSANANVFVGAYANWVLDHPGATFAQFLRHAAPYESESDLRKYLDHLGIRVVDRQELLGPDSKSADILDLLDRAYAAQIAYKHKSTVVIKHDADQLAGLNADIAANRRSVFVTADRSLRNALEGTRFSYLAGAMISHVGLAQLVDLLVRPIEDRAGLSGLIWSGIMSDDSDKLRNYLIDLALAEHDAALTKRMHHIIDEIAEDATFALKNEGLPIEPRNEKEQRDLQKTLELYETQFYRNMREEMERMGYK